MLTFKMTSSTIKKLWHIKSTSRSIIRINAYCIKIEVHLPKPTFISGKVILEDGSLSRIRSMRSFNELEIVGESGKTTGSVLIMLYKVNTDSS